MKKGILTKIILTIVAVALLFLLANIAEKTLQLKVTNQVATQQAGDSDDPYIAMTALNFAQSAIEPIKWLIMCLLVFLIWRKTFQKKTTI